MGILFNSTALGIHFCETSLIFNFKTRLGGEICLCDVNMYKGYSVYPKIFQKGAKHRAKKKLTSVVSGLKGLNVR